MPKRIEQRRPGVAVEHERRSVEVIRRQPDIRRRRVQRSKKAVAFVEGGDDDDVTEGPSDSRIVLTLWFGVTRKVLVDRWDHRFRILLRPASTKRWLSAWRVIFSDSLDSRDVTARFAISDVQIFNRGKPQQPGDRRLDFRGHHGLVQQEPAVALVRLEHQGEVTQLRWKCANRVKRTAFRFVDEDWTGRGIVSQFLEWVVSEKQSALFTFVKLPKTLPAGAVTLGELRVHRVSILWRFAGRANLLR